MSKPLQFLPDAFDAETHEALDAQVMKAWMGGAKFAGACGLPSNVVKFSSGLLDPKFERLENAMGLLANHAKLPDMLQDALNNQRFVDIRNHAILRKPNRSSESAILPTSTAAASVAWTKKFHRDYHKVMLQNINSTDCKAHYANLAAIIQSSGSMKSRTVDELADLVSTTLFNLRNSGEHGSAAYPPQDTNVRNYLRSIDNVKDRCEAEIRDERFISHLCLEVAKEVEQVFSGQYVSSTHELACTWKRHLSMNENRSKLHGRVIEPCEHPVPERTLPKHQPLQALRNAGDPQSADNVNAVKVILYFDEAHALKPVVAENAKKKPLYNALWSSLGSFNDDAIFTLFLSTQSSLTLLAPAAERARSSREQNPYDVQPPITEMPLDCHPCFPLQLGQFTLEDLKELPFLA
ncbi:hypothetical protein F5I97DRAFT_1923134 [Phlebopus sp. FC_14]|nr:hypothetical protein F5I97DRAFT_1923134 [Phlebopus sp. FC_14]